MGSFKVWLAGILGRDARESFSSCVIKLRTANKFLMQERTVKEHQIMLMQKETEDFNVMIASNEKIADAIKQIADALNEK